ncbi:hypothetical protein [Geomonas sp.]|uniref:hypothetical protein n=1 Tax=Geomonas sp. TaxID=2651584 RepID=UPI002B481E8A|nr:hypothetical protein [Geomonas sp.]HJV33435.1 hypothetical protein [Geomonas sp.]
MVKKLKYVALSALVLPGLGQLCLGRRVKGAVMIVLDNIFILAALFLALRSAGKLMLAGGKNVDSAQVLAAVQTDAPYARWLLGGFLLLWVYGIVDAATDQGSSNN